MAHQHEVETTSDTTAIDRDVKDFLAFFVREAHRDAADVAGLLHALTEAGWDVSPLLNRSSLQLLAVAIRLYRWERSGVVCLLATDFPSADAVLRQALGGDAVTDDAHDLLRSLLRVQFDRLAWQPWPRTGSDITLADHGQSVDALDVVARFLWQFRHLGRKETP